MQIRGVIIENTFSSIQDVAPAVLPLLSPFIGPGRWVSTPSVCTHPPTHLRAGTSVQNLGTAFMSIHQSQYEGQSGPGGTILRAAHWVTAARCATRRLFNFLIRNKWESLKNVRKGADTPMLLMSSLKVPSSAQARRCADHDCWTAALLTAANGDRNNREEATVDLGGTH